MATRGGECMTRRSFGAMTVGTLAALSLGGSCHDMTTRPGADGRLTARPRPNGSPAGEPPDMLKLDARHGALFRPPTRADGSPMPLLVLLHGAGGTGTRVLARLGPAADDAGLAVLAPTARWGTWDAIRGETGPDVVFVNRALQRVFDTAPIDPDRIVVGGFSDGATYALALGLVNGDLFKKVIAFSAGFLMQGTPHGRPRFFVSHGTHDTVLPIDQCGRPIVATLQKSGYEVTFREFSGGHEVPPEVAHDAMGWAALP